MDLQSMSLTDEDIWTINSILGSDASTLDLEDVQKDLEFLGAPPLALTVDTSADSIMNHAFATENCFSPQLRPKPTRQSFDMLTLDPLPLDVLTFVSQPSKRINYVAPPVIKPATTTTTTPLSPPKKCKQCIAPGCTRRAQSNNRCKSHGGGARCTVAGCGKSSQGGGLCRAHGGGKKCKFPGCTKGTQRLGLCYLHGGIRRCTFPGCVKKDRGNGFCISHGGGKKCSAPKCIQPVVAGAACALHTVPPPPPAAPVKLEPFVGRAISMR
ncbi:hypothetical protein LEN26_007832 [Aphanomyces euteiches]|nr:hypothetical protein AeMF1_008850 [Aphanomyces euteiches]KAH9131188.1 hypothetical protein LEN26_007832 [Aphanomyces euteiches]KAH9196240.1 hypothetical protein AeNC1_001804 [Aphanomyces euteiches]